MSDRPGIDAEGSAADPLSTLSLADQVVAAEATFQQEYGSLPQWVAAAPGRVNLIGEHTDYNEGFVFPLAIERYTIVAGSRRDDADRQVDIFSPLVGEHADFSLADLERDRQDWTSYVRGVVAGFSDRGFDLPGLKLLVDSNVPLGSGLSSSAALEVATATLLEAVAGTRLDPIEKARLCQQAEHEYAGMPCGIMDQFSSALGEKDRLLLIDCRTETAELVSLANSDLAVLIVNSNVRHALTDGEYAERRSQCVAAAKALQVSALRDVTYEQLESKAECLEPILYRRARHVITENDRTVQAAAAIRAGDLELLGDLMYQSHYSLRDDYQVSCEELDVLVDAARQIGAEGGVVGSRMTGGGFGGCTVTLVAEGRQREVAEQIAAVYQQTTGKTATPFVTRPARGAHLIKP